MKKEELEKRLQELNQYKNQLQANYNTAEGMIQECIYWLKKLSEVKEAVQEAPKDTASKDTVKEVVKEVKKDKVA